MRIDFIVLRMGSVPARITGEQAASLPFLNKSDFKICFKVTDQKNLLQYCNLNITSLSYFICSFGSSFGDACLDEQKKVYFFVFY